jgi:prepilin signal peptidase PulO-like enzyme (type II secretory pathway)
LRWFELIPVFSYMWFRAKCRRCGSALSFLYPVSEIVTGAGLVFLYQSFGGPTLPFLFGAIIFCAFVVLFISDARTQILPDGAVIVSGLATLGFLASRGASVPTIALHLVVGACASAFFAALWAITRGRGMGLGDVKLAFVLGLLLGYPKIVVGLYVAFLTGAAVGVILILRRKLKLKSKIAFGPFLLLGGVVGFVWGDAIIELWKALV